MSAKAQWFRLSVNWSESEWLDALPWPVRAVWTEVLSTFKSNGRNGVMPVTPLHRLAGSKNIPVEFVEAFFTAAIAEGAIILDGDTWKIAKWGEYQIDDTTNAERQKKLREARKHNGVMPVTVTQNNDHNGVTPSRVTTRPPDNNHLSPSEMSPPCDGEPEVPDLRLVEVPWFESEDIDQPCRSALAEIATIPRFLKYLLAEPGRSRTAIENLWPKARDAGMSSDAFIEAAESCRNFYSANKKYTDGVATFRDWVKRDLERAATSNPKRKPGGAASMDDYRQAFDELGEVGS